MNITNATHENLTPILKDIDQMLSDGDSAHYADAQTVLEKMNYVLEITEELGDYRRFTHALGLNAWANSHLRNHELALITACETLRLSRAYKLKKVEIRAIGTAANVFRFCGLNRESERLYRMMREQSQTITDGKLRSLSINNHTMSRYDLGQTSNLVEDLLEALDALPEDTNYFPQTRTMILTNIALVLTRVWGKHEEAISYAVRALNQAHDAGLYAQVAATHHTMADIYMLMGDVTAAENCCIQAAEYIVDDVSLNSVNGLLIMGRIRVAQGRDIEALEMWENAYNAAVRNNMLHFAIRSLEKIKELHERVEDLDMAIETYRRLTEDIVKYQRQHEDLRLTILALIFADNKSEIESRTQLSMQWQVILDRLSHEFRTPLTVIQSSSDLIEDYGERMSTDKRQKHLQGITAQVKALTLILENISRLFNNMSLAASTGGVYSLNTLTVLAIGHLERDGLPSHRVEISGSNEAMAKVMPNKHIEDILYQLLSNALRYSSDVVTLNIFSHEHAVVLTVADSGIGIPEDEQRIVFEPLVRGSNQHLPTGGGLGLAIVSKIVLELGGVINLVSNTNQGTTITVRLPYIG